MYTVCKNHIEEAIDEFVEIYEMPPDIYKLKEVSFKSWDVPSHCSFCHETPLYLIV